MGMQNGRLARRETKAVCGPGRRSVRGKDEATLSVPTLRAPHLGSGVMLVSHFAKEITSQTLTVATWALEWAATRLERSHEKLVVETTARSTGGITTP